MADEHDGQQDGLHHHGDVEATPGLLDLAVNVFPGPRPTWLDDALRASLDDIGRYPDPTSAEAALAAYHHREPADCVATAGAAEAFTLLARRPWRRPVVVHPQFTEPHAALLAAGHDVGTAIATAPFALPAVPDDADLVVLGNPTNPTGVLHPASAVRALVRPGRTVVVDEAFMDAVPGEPESLADHAQPGLVVVRSLTKQWSIPGVRAGYLLGHPDDVAPLRAARTPWSVSTAAAAAMSACATEVARDESVRRAGLLAAWRLHLEAGLRHLDVHHVPSATAFVLARPGLGVHSRLREAGVAVRRCDTFPGLDGSWVRLAVRPPEVTDRVLALLDAVLGDCPSA
ncbi:Rv2231c family pyridoxal phosphate-dependent protein CobC [Nocardioides flavescens]|uniref:Rv2231c family pyridoxal phosphate-dependent protein CobC n=1 Tax=Nocardioides flavescens TaxID=2691959 RepID=UPI001EED0F8C|nr:Rv2231c family pyridoxal phosphate-dependent protein CobC [Nocardioides flavescens]